MWRPFYSAVKMSEAFLVVRDLFKAFESKRRLKTRVSRFTGRNLQSIRANGSGKTVAQYNIGNSFRRTSRNKRAPVLLYSRIWFLTYWLLDWRRGRRRRVFQDFRGPSTPQEAPLYMRPNYPNPPYLRYWRLRRRFTRRG